MQPGRRTVVVKRGGFDFDLRDHGIAVLKGLLLSMKVGRDPAHGTDRIYVGINANPFVFVEVDPQSGKSTQYNAAKGCEGPWDMAFAPDGRILITSINGALSLFDPRRKKLRVVARADTWFWTIACAGDGKFYLGGSPDAKLFRYDLQSRVLEDLGSVHPREKAVRGLVAGDDGFLYGSIGFTAAQVIARDIRSGKTTSILPEHEAGPGGHALGRGTDGAVYARCMSGAIYRLDGGRATPIPTTKFHGFMPLRLSNGDRVTYVDTDTVQIGEGPRARLIPVKYQTTGAGIFHVAEGPGGKVYGSTIMPLYLFRYTPRTGKLQNLGRGAPETGEIYSFSHCDGKLYYATYGGEGSLLVYDPAKPWRPGKSFHDWTNNPRVISVLGEGHCRPRAMCVDARKCIWVGSYPEYGRYNGALLCYDTVRKKLWNNPVVIPNQSICSLACDPSAKVVYGGTDITPGTGANPVTKDARLFAWDVAAREVLWELVPFEGEESIPNLLFLNGKLYGTTRWHGTFFMVDPKTRRVEKVIESKIQAAREQAMLVGLDGNIYGTARAGLFRWRPEGEVEFLCRLFGRRVRRYGGVLFGNGAAIIGARIYFPSGPHLMSLRLP